MYIFSLRKRLVQLAIGDPDLAADVWRTLVNDIDFLKFLSPYEKKILPQCYANLSKAGVDSRELSLLLPLMRGIPDRVKQIQAEIPSTIRKFNELGVSPLLLKGAALVELFPDKCTPRGMVDIDLLIPLSVRDITISRLETAGWRSSSTHSSYFRNWSHALPMQTPSGVNVDLHWWLMPEDMDKESANSIIARAIQIQNSDLSYKVMDPSNFIFHLCIHGGRVNGGAGLQWIVDVLILLESNRQPDWVYLKERAGRANLSQSLAKAFQILTEYGANIPADVIANLKRHPISYIEGLQFKKYHKREVKFRKMSFFRILNEYFEWYLIWFYRFRVRSEWMSPLNFLKYFTNAESLRLVIRNGWRLIKLWQRNRQLQRVLDKVLETKVPTPNLARQMGKLFPDRPLVGRIAMMQSLKVWIHIFVMAIKYPNMIHFGIRCWNFMSNKPQTEEVFKFLKRGDGNNNAISIDEMAQVNRYINLIDLIALVHPRHPRCLVKSVILANWMEGVNLNFKFKIGWRKKGVAHAWIELNGKIINSLGEWQDDCLAMDVLPHKSTAPSRVVL